MKLNLFIELILIICSGFFDGQAFSRIPLIWESQSTNRWSSIVYILLLFNIGNLFYIAASYFLHTDGLNNGLMMTLLWFVTTIVSLSIINGSFVSLPLIDKFIALLSIVLIGMLYFRGVAS